MKLFFSTLRNNILGCFQGRMLIWHLAAVFLTLALGFDWHAPTARQHACGSRQTADASVTAYTQFHRL